MALLKGRGTFFANFTIEVIVMATRLERIHWLAESHLCLQSRLGATSEDLCLHKFVNMEMVVEFLT